MVYLRPRSVAPICLAAVIVVNVCLALHGAAFAASARDNVPPVPSTSSQVSGQIVASSPLSLSTTIIVGGGPVSAAVTLQNQGSSSISLNGIVIAARAPTGANADFGGIWGVTLAPGQTVALQRNRTFTVNDPAGAWTIFASYQTSDAVWHPLAPALSLMVAGTSPPAGGSLALGATIRDNGTSIYPTSGLLAWYANLVGRMPAIVNVGSDFVHNASFDPVMMSYLQSNGTMPMWTWMPEDDTQGAYQSSYTDRAVANGAYDGYIRQFALAAKQWGRPFLLRLAHEMNGTWFPWSTGAGNPNRNNPADYVAMWEHVHDIFTSVGATNARWVWCANTSQRALPHWRRTIRVIRTWTGWRWTAITGAATPAIRGSLCRLSSAPRTRKPPRWVAGR